MVKAIKSNPKKNVNRNYGSGRCSSKYSKKPDGQRYNTHEEVRRNYLIEYKERKQRIRNIYKNLNRDTCAEPEQP